MNRTQALQKEITITYSDTTKNNPVSTLIIFLSNQSEIIIKNMMKKKVKKNI